MTKQEAFDKVWNHFITNDGPQSITIVGSCLYRLDRDPKSPIRCAAGVLIPDELYEQEMEGSTSNTVILKYPLVGDILQDAYGLVREMQLLHDDCREISDGSAFVDGNGKIFPSFREAMEFGLRLIAEKRELKIPEAA